MLVNPENHENRVLTAYWGCRVHTGTERAIPPGGVVFDGRAWAGSPAPVLLRGEERWVGETPPSPAQKGAVRPLPPH